MPEDEEVLHVDENEIKDQIEINFKENLIPKVLYNYQQTRNWIAGIFDPTKFWFEVDTALYKGTDIKISEPLMISSSIARAIEILGLWGESIPESPDPAKLGGTFNVATLESWVQLWNEYEVNLYIRYPSLMMEKYHVFAPKWFLFASNHIYNSLTIHAGNKTSYFRVNDWEAKNYFFTVTDVVDNEGTHLKNAPEQCVSFALKCFGLRYAFFRRFGKLLGMDLDERYPPITDLYAKFPYIQLRHSQSLFALESIVTAEILRRGWGSIQPAIKPEKEQKPPEPAPSSAFF